MKMKNLTNSIMKTFYRVSFKCRKHAPEIGIVVGAAGTVVGTVMACKATRKADDVLKETAEQKDKIERVKHMTETKELPSDSYSDEDYKKDLTITYAQTGLKLVKIYAPAVAVSGLSIACILASGRVFKKRNVALAAAYATADKSLKDYRERVIDRFGEKIDKELRYNIKAREVTETITDDEGSSLTTKTTVDAIDPNELGDYAKIFDESCTGWKRDPERNLFFLKQQQNWANERLKARGYLFLNEVYESLGFMPTKAGQCVGWIYDESDPLHDNYVDFGIFNVNSVKARDFVNGYEPSIILDFNCDGNILDLI